LQLGVTNESLVLTSTVVINVIATANSTINGAVATYINPIIPKGFKAIYDGAVWPTDWDKGLVIQDALGNQFVWIPVDGTNVPYAKWCTTDISYTETTDDILPIGITSETNQITKYGGFYIARYEARDVSTKLVSKKNIYDLAGGSWKFTSEKCEVTFDDIVMSCCILRAGDYSLWGSDFPADSRYAQFADSLSVGGLNFRVALYIL